MQKKKKQKPTLIRRLIETDDLQNLGGDESCRKGKMPGASAGGIAGVGEGKTTENEGIGFAAEEFGRWR